MGAQGVSNRTASDNGPIANFDEAAAQVGVSRARWSQIMRLMDLPPEVQETVLIGDGEIAERRLRGRFLGCGRCRYAPNPS